MFNYNKFKDAKPQDTVDTLKRLLEEIDVETDVFWANSEYEGAVSNRVTVSDTSLGTNGKGTDVTYALASGYAELIERIENGTLYIGYQSSQFIKETGFIYCPDEVFVPVETLAVQNDPFTKFLFDHYRLTTKEEKISFLKELPYLHNDTSDDIRCIPFADISNDRIVFIPLEIMLPIYGSNGMAAGNTMEEALVQALSEILERYANKAVIDGVVPPEIPRTYWEKAQTGRLIKEIEKSGRYRVSLRDCSLGKEIPATAIVISDLEKGKCGIHFSCHPSFEVSVERTLTEALQGKDLDCFTSMNIVGNAQMCYCVDNYPNLMKIGAGAYPVGFFTAPPSYEFKTRESWNELTNKDMLIKMLAIIRNEGFDVLVRDASHLGFPAYHVIIPGMSEMFFSNGRRIKELRTSSRVVSSMKKFPNLSQEEENRLMLFIKYKEFSVMESSFSWISTIPFIGDQMTTDRIRAYLHYKRGEYGEASAWFSRTAKQMESCENKMLYSCAAEYARLMQIGTKREEVESIIGSMYYERIANIVIKQLHDPTQVLINAFAPICCDQCEKCSYAENDCEYYRIEKVLRKIKSALSKSTVSQKNILERLVSLK